MKPKYIRGQSVKVARGGVLTYSESIKPLLTPVDRDNGSSGIRLGYPPVSLQYNNL